MKPLELPLNLARTTAHSLWSSAQDAWDQGNRAAGTDEEAEFLKTCRRTALEESSVVYHLLSQSRILIQHTKIDIDEVANIICDWVTRDAELTKSHGEPA